MKEILLFLLLLLLLSLPASLKIQYVKYEYTYEYTPSSEVIKRTNFLHFRDCMLSFSLSHLLNHQYTFCNFASQFVSDFAIFSRFQDIHAGKTRILCCVSEHFQPNKNHIVMYYHKKTYTQISLELQKVYADGSDPALKQYVKRDSFKKYIRAAHIS